MKTGLVLEGGAYRILYSSGVLDALLDGGVPLPDYMLGVSAGAAYGVSYLAKQSRRNLDLLAHYAPDPRYGSFRNLLNPKNRCYFDFDFSYIRIPDELVPIDYAALEAYPGEFEAGLTDVESGEPVFMPVPRHESPNIVLEATCALPFFFPLIEIDGHKYLDGGCSDPIPWRYALEKKKVDRLVVILTRPRDYVKTGGEAELKLLKATYRKYPKFVEAMRLRAERYNESRDELFAREAAGDVLVLAPETTFGVKRLDRDVPKLRRLWQEGYFHGLKERERIRDYWKGVS